MRRYARWWYKKNCICTGIKFFYVIDSLSQFKMYEVDPKITSSSLMKELDTFKILFLDFPQSSFHTCRFASRDEPQLLIRSCNFQTPRIFCVHTRCYPKVPNNKKCIYFSPNFGSASNILYSACNSSIESKLHPFSQSFIFGNRKSHTGQDLVSWGDAGFIL